MEFNLTKYTPDKDKLKIRGFEKLDDELVLKMKLDDELYLKISIDNKFLEMRVDVVDVFEDEKFQPFYLITDTSYSSKIKYEVEVICENIISDCFFENDIKSKIKDYCLNNFDSFKSNPFSNAPNFEAFKVGGTIKWFALLFYAPHNKVNKSINSTEVIDILNLKIDNEIAIKYIDNKNYFEGYHMNHKKWLTIYLNNSLDFETVKELIDMSYKNVIKK